jgi:hypothetical protein
MSLRSKPPASNIFLRDPSALVTCGSARKSASPLWFLFHVAALRPLASYIWKRTSSTYSRSIMAGGTSGRGIGHFSNEVTAIFATRAIGAHHWLRKDKAAQAIVSWLSKVKS